MTFTERHNLLKNSFDPSKNFIQPEGSDVDIYFPGFTSYTDDNDIDGHSLNIFRNSIRGGVEDENILQNKKFSYPVFTPSGKKQNDRAIILLHGLNERKWDKYLAWADYLTEKTGKSVIIFPISFHLNRSEPCWLDFREMNRQLATSSGIMDPAGFSTCINYMLSERLNASPERFFLSGLQTANDLVLLLEQIKNGQHPLFTKGASADIFAYSIGGLLAQILFIANPKELLNDSKMFLLCAGSLFSQMNGVSKLIINRKANERIQEYYRRELEENISKSKLFSEFFNSSKIGMAFRAMIRPDKFSNIREKVFRASEKRIHAVGLENDKVIPSECISETLLGSRNHPPKNMEIFDFNYPYTHEMPFPVKLNEFRQQVDDAFELVFKKAAEFLA